MIRLWYEIEKRIRKGNRNRNFRDCEFLIDLSAIEFNRSGFMLKLVMFLIFWIINRCYGIVSCLPSMEPCHRNGNEFLSNLLPSMLWDRLMSEPYRTRYIMSIDVFFKFTTFDAMEPLTLYISAKFKISSLINFIKNPPSLELSKFIILWCYRAVYCLNYRGPITSTWQWKVVKVGLKFKTIDVTGPLTAIKNIKFHLP